MKRRKESWRGRKRGREREEVQKRNRGRGGKREIEGSNMSVAD